MSLLIIGKLSRSRPPQRPLFLGYQFNPLVDKSCWFDKEWSKLEWLIPKLQRPIEGLVNLMPVTTLQCYKKSGKGQWVEEKSLKGLMLVFSEGHLCTRSVNPSLLH